MYSKFIQILVFISFSFWQSLWLHAQSTPSTIQGTIYDSDGQSISFAAVLLLNQVDSSRVAGKLTNEQGEYFLSDIPAGEYLLLARYDGMQSHLSSRFSLYSGEQKVLDDIFLKVAAFGIDTVLIPGLPPPIQSVPGGGWVLEPAHAIGNSAFDFLPQVPGIQINPSSQAIQSVKGSVKVFINGKASPLSAEELATYLNSIAAAQIAEIKYLPNPPASYVSEGNTVIDIILKKNQDHGVNATVNLGYAHGIWSKYNGGASLNYRSEHVNAYGSYSLGTGLNQEFINGTRMQAETDFHFETQTLKNYQNHNFRGGLDWFIKKGHTLGVQINGILGKEDWLTGTDTRISPAGRTDVLSIFEAESDNLRNTLQWNANLNYRFDGEAGSQWTVDADYGSFNILTDSYQPNVSKDATGTNIVQTDIFTSQAPNVIDILTLKADHSRAIGSGSLSAGVRSSYVRTDNSFELFRLAGTKSLLDSGRSSSFLYQEQVNAAYLSYAASIKKVNIQLGLRAEQSRISGELTRVGQQYKTEQVIDTSYLNLFPTLSLSYQHQDGQSTTLAYSRRIARPNYQNLNPFEVRWDSMTFRRGNPFLRPQFTQNIELSHGFGHGLNMSAGLSLTKGFMTQLTDTLNATSTYLSWFNLDAQQMGYATLTHSFSPIKGKSWNVFTNASLNHVRNMADYGSGKSIDLRYTAYTVFQQHSLLLPGNMILNVSGLYMSPTVWGANFQMDKRWKMDASIQKAFKEGRAKLKIGMTDIFGTFGWDATQEFGSLALDIYGGLETRQVSVNLSWLLGNNKVKVKKRESGLGQLLDRAKMDK